MGILEFVFFEIPGLGKLRLQPVHPGPSGLLVFRRFRVRFRSGILRTFSRYSQSTSACICSWLLGHCSRRLQQSIAREPEREPVRKSEREADRTDEPPKRGASEEQEGAGEIVEAAISAGPAPQAQAQKGARAKSRAAQNWRQWGQAQMQVTPNSMLAVLGMWYRSNAHVVAAAARDVQHIELRTSIGISLKLQECFSTCVVVKEAWYSHSGSTVVSCLKAATCSGLGVQGFRV